MSGLREHLLLGLRLHFRNRMALLYGYLFPLIFLVAFWVLYRHERLPLIRHLGELLTVSVLGGACFGLPTTLVSERERGVWRRYRLAPIATGQLIASTVMARYIIVLSAGALQFLLALAIGMPFPAHPLGLWVAFTVVAFAFIGLGLVIAMLADNVPAVQALGQCIFLPMLIIGGVAVQLASLPVWAQHVSAFFPGRYAVEALQANANGWGLAGARFSLLSLLMIGFAGCLAGTKLFRWESGQRFARLPHQGWLAVALAAWLAVGALAEYRGHIRVRADSETPEPTPVASVGSPNNPATPQSTEKIPPASVTTPVQTSPAAASTAVVPPVPTTASPTPSPAPNVSTVPQSTPALSPPTPTPSASPTPSPVGATITKAARPESWDKVTASDIASLDYSVPPDDGVVSPIAPPDEQGDEDVGKQIAAVSRNLIDWAPGKVKDPVQRVRNCLYVCAVPDIVQLPVERFLPILVLEHLEDNIPKDDLQKALAWIVLHPDQGTVISETTELGVDASVGDPEQIRERTYYYALKFLARLTGRKY